MMRISFLLFFCLAAQAFAYKPTIESLFRNGSNASLGQNTAFATFILKRKNRVEEESSETLRSMPSEFTYKFLFSNESADSKLVQVSHIGSAAEASATNDVKYFPRLSFSAMRLGPEDEEKKFFYSLMSSLINNDGRLMVEFFRDIGAPVLPNSERVDKEQLYYLGKYVKYLKLEEEEREAQENPLEPADEDSRKKIKEIFKRPFLTPSPYVRRVKEGTDFFWIAESEKFFAKFTHDDHQLLEMTVKTPNGELSAKCFNYILYGQDIQFPELILFKDLKGDEYLLNMKKISNFPDTSERFMGRIGDYKKDMEKSGHTESPAKSSLIL